MTVVEDPTLVGLRDASVLAIERTLASEWREATRGLSELKVVSGSEDILIRVVAGKGISYHTQDPVDKSEHIVVFVAGDIGVRSVENVVMVAMHELGHIWCCSGPEAGEDFHWKVDQVSPGLYGVDQYGLMSTKVQCLVLANGIVSCPNRFSDRELRQMGFVDIPPPPPNPCIEQRNALESRTSQMKVQLTSLDGQIAAIEASYPGALPRDVYARYSSLIASYNATNAERNRLIGLLNALPCG